MVILCSCLAYRPHPQVFILKRIWGWGWIHNIMIVMSMITYLAHSPCCGSCPRCELPWDREPGQTLESLAQAPVPRTEGRKKWTILMRCNSVLQMSGSTPLSSQICIHVNCSTIQMTYIELCLESWFTGIRLSLFQCFKGWPEVIGWYLGVPTHDRLQHGVVNKHVLFLWQQKQNNYLRSP